MPLYKLQRSTEKIYSFVDKTIVNRSVEKIRFIKMSKLPMLLFIIVLSKVLATPGINSKRSPQKYATPSNKLLYRNDRVYKNYNYSTNRAHNNNFLRIYKPGVNASKARIARQKFNMKQNAYSYGFESENGIEIEESGKSINVTPNTESPVVVKGHFAFITPEGLRVSVKYTADETGFHPIITYDGANAKLLANQPRPADVIINRIDRQKDPK